MQYVRVQGEQVPALGFGTWQLAGRECERGVEDALAIGYRHIDTAQWYDNEAEVGRAIRTSGVPRDQIFLVTKVRPDRFHHEQVIDSTHESLRKLAVEHVDLLLMHWPNPDVPVEETLGAMLELQRAGKVRHLGVSNFPPSLVERAGRTARIFANQVEYHPFLSQDKLREQARRLDYMLTAYSPLAKGKVGKDPTLQAIAGAHGKTPGQVVLRWLVQQDHVAAIPKAGSGEHRRGNLHVFDFELTAEEMERIHGLNRDERLTNSDGNFAWER